MRSDMVLSVAFSISYRTEVISIWQRIKMLVEGCEMNSHKRIFQDKYYLKTIKSIRLFHIFKITFDALSKLYIQNFR